MNNIFLQKKKNVKKISDWINFNGLLDFFLGGV